MKQNTPRRSYRNPLHVVEAHVLGAAVIEARGARIGMVCHLARLLQRAAVLEVGGDAGPAKRVVSDRGGDAGLLGTPADHGVCLARGNGAPGKALRAPAAAGGDRREQGSLRLRAETAPVEPGVKVGLKVMVAGHFMPLDLRDEFATPDQRSAGVTEVLSFGTAPRA